MSLDWTEERVALLRRRRDEGATAAAIAAELGCSRNAVLGAARRMSLPAAGSRPRPGARSPKQAKVVPKKVRALIGKPVSPDVLLVEEIVAAEPKRGVPLWRLRRTQCRWLDVGGPPWVFCGAPRTRGSYCAEHAARVFYRPNNKEENDVQGLV